MMVVVVKGVTMFDYSARIADLTPGSHELPPGTTPFPTKYVRRSTSLTFNVADYARQLMTDFLIAGGTIETREFHTPQELTALPQRAIINCTGYAARQLWSDESIVPVRGQIALADSAGRRDLRLVLQRLECAGQA